jgi:hypothetical protein
VQYHWNSRFIGFLCKNGALSNKSKMEDYNRKKQTSVPFSSCSFGIPP